LSYKLGRIVPIRWGQDGLTTDSTDNPPDFYMAGILSDPLNWEVTIPLPASNEPATFGFGSIEFIPDVENDVTGAWSGRHCDLKLGGTYGAGTTATTMSYSQYVNYWRFNAVDIEYNEDVARLLVRDQLAALDHPIQKNTYAGAGDYEGGSDVAGKYKPVVFGQPFNVPALLIDDTNYIYQLHDGLLAEIISVRVNGLPLTDVGDSTDLPSWTGGSAGQYKTDLSRGLIRLWEQPDGTVTANPRRVPGGAGEVMRDMLEWMGIDTIDQGSFDGFDVNTVGFFAGPDAVNGLEAIQRMAAGMDSWIYSTRSGQIKIQRHGNPRIDMPVFSLEGRSNADRPCVISDLQRLSATPCPSSIVVRYAQNHSVLTDQALDTTIGENTKTAMKQEWTSIAASDNASASTYTPNSQTAIIDSPFRFVVGAEALRDRLSALIGSKRDLFEVTTTTPMFQIEPGDIVKIFYDRFGLSNGRNGEVISLIENSNSTTIRVLMVE
jgi:hypothetical protein